MQCNAIQCKKKPPKNNNIKTLFLIFQFHKKEPRIKFCQCLWFTDSIIKVHYFFKFHLSLDSFVLRSIIAFGAINLGLLRFSSPF